MGLDNNKLSDDDLDEVFGGRSLFSFSDRRKEEEEKIKQKQEKDRALKNRPGGGVIV